MGVDWFVIKVTCFDCIMMMYLLHLNQIIKEIGNVYINESSESCILERDSKRKQL